MRFIVAGSGFAEQHLTWLSECPDAEIVGLLTRSDSDSARNLAARFGIQRLGKNLPELIRATKADALVVATPPSTHAALLQTGLESGLHVVSDKPLAANLRDAAALVQAAEDSRQSAMVTFQWRCHPGFIFIREHLREGRIGSFSHAEIQFHHDFLAPRETRWAWRHHPDQAGAGTLADQGVHLFDLLRFTTGMEWTVVAAHGHKLWPRRLFNGSPIDGGTEDVAAVTLTTAARSHLALLHSSRVATGLRRLRYAAYGTAGMIELTVNPDDGSGALHLRTSTGETQREDYVAPSLNPYAPFLAARLAETNNPPATFRDGMVAQEFLEAAVTLIEHRHDVEKSDVYLD